MLDITDLWWAAGSLGQSGDREAQRENMSTEINKHTSVGTLPVKG